MAYIVKFKKRFNMENVDGKLFVGSFNGETIVEVGQTAEPSDSIGRGFTKPIIINDVFDSEDAEDTYPLTVRVKNNGDIDEELSASVENHFRLQFGILFCPRMVCTVDANSGQEYKVPSVEMNPEETSGICFEIFTRVFEKLKEKNLVEEFDLNEMECLIEAFHPDYRILENIDSLVSNTHFGIGFWLGNLPKNVEVTSEQEAYMLEVQNILIELKSEYALLENEEMKLQYHLECCFNQ